MPAWRKISAREVYACPYFRVTEEQVLKPDDSKGIYHVVIGTKAAAIVALDQENNIYLIKEQKYIPGELLTIPAGGVRDGESFLAAAKRELTEETGLQAEKWTDLGYFWIGPGRFRTKGYCFLAQKLKKGRQKLDSTERIEVAKTPFSRALKMIKKGVITDAWAIVPIFKAKLYLGL